MYIRFSFEQFISHQKLTQHSKWKTYENRHQAKLLHPLRIHFAQITTLERLCVFWFFISLNRFRNSTNIHLIELCFSICRTHGALIFHSKFSLKLYQNTHAHKNGHPVHRIYMIFIKMFNRDDDVRRKIRSGVRVWNCFSTLFVCQNFQLDCVHQRRQRSCSVFRTQTLTCYHHIYDNYITSQITVFFFAFFTQLSILFHYTCDTHKMHSLSQARLSRSTRIWRVDW